MYKNKKKRNQAFSSLQVQFTMQSTNSLIQFKLNLNPFSFFVATEQDPNTLQVSMYHPHWAGITTKPW